jgi:hypothetical protein
MGVKGSFRPAAIANGDRIQGRHADARCVRGAHHRVGAYLVDGVLFMGDAASLSRRRPAFRSVALPTTSTSSRRRSVARARALQGRTIRRWCSATGSAASAAPLESFAR